MKEGSRRRNKKQNGKCVLVVNVAVYIRVHEVSVPVHVQLTERCHLWSSYAVSPTVLPLLGTFLELLL
jgi:hypothetical protein